MFKVVVMIIFLTADMVVMVVAVDIGFYNYSNLCSYI